MKDDPAIQRIRDTRHEISAACDHDPQKLVAYYLERQRKRQEAERRKVKPKQEV